MHNPQILASLSLSWIHIGLTNPPLEIGHPGVPPVLVRFHGITLIRWLGVLS